MRDFFSLLLTPLLVVASVASAADQVSVPRADHHQHLQSPAVVTLLSTPPPAAELPPDLASLWKRRPCWLTQM